MLNPFPDLLTFSFFAPTLLRVVAACLFLYMAYATYHNRSVLAEKSFPIIGHGAFVPYFAGIVILVIGVSLLVGYLTQVGAILGAVTSLKGIYFRNYRELFPYSRVAYGLLFVICLTLLLTGAGAFAFDIPL